MNSEKVFKSYAKINIGLSIPFKYSNNYHHIVSLFQPIDLFDEMSIKINLSKSNLISMDWENHLPDFFPIDKNVFSEYKTENLIFRAFHWMMSFLKKEMISLPPINVQIHIKKSIPSPGGLGGGSSNAATLLLSILEFMKSELVNQDFHEIFHKLQEKSIEIGADVPFFLNPQTAIISGVGETWKTFPNLKLTGIMAIPSFGFSTKEMYSALKKPEVNISSQAFQSAYGQISKKSLQHDNLSGINLKKVHDDFNNLHETLNMLNSGIIIDDQYEILKGLALRENNRTLFVKNEFFQVIEKIYPGKFLFLEEIRKAACDALINLTEEKYVNPVISSMSGSGSAVYAAIFNTNKLKSDFEKNLLKQIEKLKGKYSDVIWLKFCSLK